VVTRQFRTATCLSCKSHGTAWHRPAAGRVQLRVSDAGSTPATCWCSLCTLHHQLICPIALISIPALIATHKLHHHHNVVHNQDQWPSLPHTLLDAIPGAGFFHSHDETVPCLNQEQNRILHMHCCGLSPIRSLRCSQAVVVWQQHAGQPAQHSCRIAAMLEVSQADAWPVHAGFSDGCQGGQLPWQSLQP
jgi:hypothetical protein